MCGIFLCKEGHTIVKTFKGDRTMFMQKKSQSSSAGKCMIGIISGVVAGATVGSVLALMFAPCSGKETRKYLKKKKDNIADTMKNTFQELKDGMCE